MADIRPFPCIRPAEALAQRVAALPYDVYDRTEAKREARKDSLSFLNIDRPETQFSDEVDMYAPEVYEKAKELLLQRIEDGTFYKDEQPCYYLYELTMNGRTQNGIVACASIDDYESGIIKKHENTREEKEQDRIRHVDVCDAQTGPIFLAYRASYILNALISQVKQDHPIYDFYSEDGIHHRVFRIGNKKDIAVIQDIFSNMNAIYIADGHHRAASAVKVGWKRRKENPSYTGEEPFNYFLSVLFPDTELQIMSYNRAVKELNGNTPSEFLASLRNLYEVIPQKNEPVSPAEKGTFGMYLDHEWYRLERKEKVSINDVVEQLDVSILQNDILNPLLGIKDPRTDDRIEFIGGIRGLAELERHVDTDMAVAFSMYPTSIGELFEVADHDRLMPPKSTWFEPKLRSGLFVHSLK